MKYVNYLWDDETANNLSPEERLVYRSNLLGSDQRVTNTGGGNTSAKLIERDPSTKEDVEVLWVKGSGGDLRTSALRDFASLYQEKLLALKNIYAASGSRGPKTEAEDRMAGFYADCAFNQNPRAASIDTPLHSFIAAKFVDHMHPNSVIAIAASRRSKELTAEIYGEEVGWTPWLRPGFELGLTIEQMRAADSRLKGVVLSQHGLINWADDDKECYELTLRLIEQAAEYVASKDKGERTFGGAKYEPLQQAERDEILFTLLPWLRGQTNRLIATVQCDASILQFVNSRDAPRLAEMGTSCPDHFLRTKIKPLYVDWDPRGADSLADSLKDKLCAGLGQYRKAYTAYYESCKRADSPPMRDPNPAVILIPGIGMIAWGKNKSESRITAEFYNCAIEVMRGAEAIDEYIALPQQEAFDVEYWSLEEAKLKRMPPEKALGRCVVLVIGAGENAQAVGRHLAEEGAHVVCAGPASARDALKQAVAAYGGVDSIVSFGFPEGQVSDEFLSYVSDALDHGPSRLNSIVIGSAAAEVVSLAAAEPDPILNALQLGTQ
jgi:rhamnulose-1-phosphate aldolase/alcohol dehydrogenase